jgi:hypothetical protein
MNLHCIIRTHCVIYFASLTLFVNLNQGTTSRGGFDATDPRLRATLDAIV